ncbi:MAG: hypothetical protein J6A19_16020 [Oscillospiraceae bacterium]|nr:hypothetical protein [Oscillospiraceae bacterium]
MDIIEALQSKNNTEAYNLLLKLEAQSAQSNELYDFFGDFVDLLQSKSSFVRVRGFRLACAQARWDTENRIEANLPVLLSMLDDDKPAAVRQCLAALHGALLYKPGLSKAISGKLDRMDLSKYKESMSHLISKDMEELRDYMG